LLINKLNKLFSENSFIKPSYTGSKTSAAFTISRVENFTYLDPIDVPALREPVGQATAFSPSANQDIGGPSDDVLSHDEPLLPNAPFLSSKHSSTIGKICRFAQTLAFPSHADNMPLRD